MADCLSASVNGAEVTFDPSGAMWWPDERLLVVADLHFEKGSAQARNGSLIPPYDTRETLNRLEAVITAHDPATVICLGDSFHDLDAAGRLTVHELEQIASLTAARHWVWIEGNHDPQPPAHLGGRVTDILEIGPLVFRHEPQPGARPGEVAGHLHPAARVRVRGRGLRRPCFVSDGARLILPSFGAYTGGLDVLDPAFALLLRPPFDVWMLGKDRLYRVPGKRLKG